MSVRRATAPGYGRSGVLISIPWDTGRIVTADTVQCCHCGCTWRWVPGSGRVRGYCGRCNGITCGCKACDACIPQEQFLTNLEKGMPPELARLYRPVRVSVPDLPPGG